MRFLQCLPLRVLLLCINRDCIRIPSAQLIANGLQSIGDLCAQLTELLYGFYGRAFGKAPVLIAGNGNKFSVKRRLHGTQDRRIVT